MSSENLETVQVEYRAGKADFERGNYRESVQHFETANSLASPSSRLGGEIQIWLVTAYEAAGRRSEALDLCRRVSRHPDYTTRKEGKRLLYILEAPKLQTRPEWLTQIPDLSTLADGTAQTGKGRSQYTSTAPAKREDPPKQLLLTEPADPTKVNTKDNQFIWVALIAIIILLGSLAWWSQA